MEIWFWLKSILLCLLLGFLTLPLLGQYSLESDSLYLDEYEVAGSAIPPFYQSLEEKNYYHSRQIHGMKKDLNSHSRNLQDLRARFNQVFYGRAGLDANGDPFRIGDEPKMPSYEELKPKVVYIPPATSNPTLFLESSGSTVGSVSIDTQPSPPLPAEDMLAFSVEAPGDYFGPDGNPVSIPTDSGVISEARPPLAFSYYIMPRAGVSVTSQIHKDPTLYRRYDPGFSASLSGGVRVDRWRIGLMALHQRNRLHSTSWIGPRSQLKGDTETNALLADFSYGIPVFTSFSLNFNGGLGYRKTTSSADWVIAGSPDSINKVDQSFVWSAGVGLDWSFSEQVSLLLAYRYFAEDTVPTHNADLGLEFDF